MKKMKIIIIFFNICLILGNIGTNLKAHPFVAQYELTYKNTLTENTKEYLKKNINKPILHIEGWPKTPIVFLLTKIKEGQLDLLKELIDLGANLK